MNPPIRATYKGKEVILDHCIITANVHGNCCYAVVHDVEDRTETVPIKKLKFLYESTRAKS
jgi:hypothetical protein